MTAFLVLSVIAVLVVGAFLVLSRPQNNKKVCINTNCFEVEVAENFLQQTRGMMFRKSLQEDKGMLFIFSKEAIYLFWMKNTKIPLDIIWINSDNKIVFIAENSLSCDNSKCPQIIPPQKAKYVLEINGKLCQKLNIKVGDSVNINTY